jgi:hypothetical protein
MPTPSFWVQVTGSSLAQGDFLPDCLVPHFRPDFGQTNNNVPVRHYDLIVVTQSCDLQNKKISLVACSPIHRLEEFETINPPFANKSRCTCSPRRHNRTRTAMPSSSIFAKSTVCPLNI